MTVRVGIAGCGFIGAVHSFALKVLIEGGLVDASVVATYDVDEERAARLADHHRARAHTDLGTMLDEVDAVWVCTWTAAHGSVVAAAVDRGRAVFCEKPLAPTLGECEHVAGLLDRVPHQVGLVLRHAPVFRAAAEEIGAGRYGRVLAASLRNDQYFPTQGLYGSDWRADVTRAGGGTLLEHSIHDVDVLTWILGPPVWVRAEVANRFGHEGVDDVATVFLGYADGGQATLLSVWHQVLTRGSNRRLEVFCDDALLWADDDHLGPLHVETSEGSHVVAGELPPWASSLPVPPEHLAPVTQYAAPTLAFLQGLTAGTSPASGWPDGAMALAAHRIVDAAYRSAGAGGARMPIGG